MNMAKSMLLINNSCWYKQVGEHAAGKTSHLIFYLRLACQVVLTYSMQRLTLYLP